MLSSSLDLSETTLDPPGITVTAHAANAMRKSRARIIADPGLRSGWSNILLTDS